VSRVSHVRVYRGTCTIRGRVRVLLASCGPGPAAVLCRDVGGGGCVVFFQRLSFFIIYIYEL